MMEDMVSAMNFAAGANRNLPEGSLTTGEPGGNGDGTGFLEDV